MIEIKFKSDDEMQMVFDGVKMNVRVRPKERTFCPSGNLVKTRIYVWFADDSEYKTRFATKIDDSEEIINRIYRTRAKWLKTFVAAPIVSKLQFDDDAKVSFSSKAGCQCGCSPGFIVNSKKQPPFDIFVDVL